MSVLVIDIGSSSARVMLYSDTAEPIPGAAASVSYRMTTSPPGAAVFDPLTLRSQVEACIDMVLQHPAAGAVEVVGLATLVGNVLGLDASGAPLTPVFTYADSRSADDVAFLKTRVRETPLFQRTGCPVHTAYHPGRLFWLRRTNPALFDQVAAWVDFGTYLYRQWFGEAPCSYSVASWSGMLSRSELVWNQRWLNVLTLDENVLPPLADYDEFRTGLVPAYAERWPALAHTPFCLAVGDGAAANIGSGCADETRIALTVGTTAALRVVSNDILPTVPEGLWGYRVDAARHLIGGATSEGGNIFRWARETLRLDGNLEDALLSRAPDAHGLTFLPLLAGERSPGWAESATGSIVGLRLSTTPLDLLQAAVEGVALRLAVIADLVLALAGPDTPVIGGGGVLRESLAWAHIISNALNRPLYITQETELTARGTAILALHALGRCALTDFPPAIAYAIEPIPAVAAVLRAARERQAQLYNLVVPRTSPYPPDDSPAL